MGAGEADAGAGARAGSPPTSPRGMARLYLVETVSKGGTHELAGHMQALTRTLEALKSEPARPWRAEVTYKTLKSAAAAKTNPLAENEQQQGPGGESLYVVKSTEFPGRTFMMAAKPPPRSEAGPAKKRAGGGGGPTVSGGSSSGAKLGGKLLSPIVETGPLGDEVVGVLKGYANRLVLTLEGSAYRVSGGLLEACAGFVSRGSALAAIVLQVRYEHAHCTVAEAYRVIEDFVSMCLPASVPMPQNPPRPSTAPAPEANGGGGAHGGLRIQPIDPPAVTAALSGRGQGPAGRGPAAAAKGSSGGGGGGGALGPGEMAGPKLRLLQYVELFGTI